MAERPNDLEPATVGTTVGTGPGASMDRPPRPEVPPADRALAGSLASLGRLFWFSMFLDLRINGGPSVSRWFWALSSVWLILALAGSASDAVTRRHLRATAAMAGATAALNVAAIAVWIVWRPAPYLEAATAVLAGLGVAHYARGAARLARARGWVQTADAYRRTAQAWVATTVLLVVGCGLVAAFGEPDRPDPAQGGITAQGLTGRTVHGWPAGVGVTIFLVVALVALFRLSIAAATFRDNLLRKQHAPNRVERAARRLGARFGPGPTVRPS